MLRLPPESNRPDPPFPYTTLFRSLTRADNGSLHALAWESGRYTTSTGVRFTATVPAPRVVEGPWTVAFQPGRGAPAQTVLPKLERSEEHTSELQSLMRTSYAVFCLKTKKKEPHARQTT